MGKHSATHRRPGSRGRKIAVCATAVAVVAGGGAAYAAWSASASGETQGKSFVAVTSVIAANTATAELYPGASASVYFTLTNPNSYAVQFTSADFSTVSVDNATACPAGNITVNDKTGLAITGPANTPVGVATTSAGALTMASTAPDGCQGRTFTITTTLAGTQV